VGVLEQPRNARSPAPASKVARRSDASERADMGARVCRPGHRLRQAARSGYPAAPACAPSPPLPELCPAAPALAADPPWPPELWPAPPDVSGSVVRNSHSLAFSGCITTSQARRRPGLDAGTSSLQSVRAVSGPASAQRPDASMTCTQAATAPAGGLLSKP